MQLTLQQTTVQAHFTKAKQKGLGGLTLTNKSSRFSVGFRGISRLGSAFIFLR